MGRVMAMAGEMSIVPFVMHRTFGVGSTQQAIGVLHGGGRLPAVVTYC